MKKLATIKNYRFTIPKVCATCKYAITKEEYLKDISGIASEYVTRYCERDQEITMNETEQYFFHVCDRYSYSKGIV